MWIFGYGSLVWRPDLPYVERRAASIGGWSRRFWQGSPDHRGVAEAPGRVVTLVREERRECWGAAYRLAVERRDEVLEALDHREKAGYERHLVKVHLRGPAEEVEGLVYIATRDNPDYLGPAPMEEILAHVRRSHGPSGSNLEYVEKLAEALRDLGVEDDPALELAGALSSSRSRDLRPRDRSRPGRDRG